LRRTTTNPPPTATIVAKRRSTHIADLLVSGVDWLTRPIGFWILRNADATSASVRAKKYCLDS